MVRYVIQPLTHQALQYVSHAVKIMTIDTIKDAEVTIVSIVTKRGHLMRNEMNKLIIGAPFGNYFKTPGVTSTVGTFTLNYRGGKLYRLWRMILTLRYYWRLQSWVNKLGLPNPGIDSHEGKFKADEIISIHGFNRGEWIQLVANCSYSNLKLFIEFNLSCPNVSAKHSIEDLKPALDVARNHGHIVIAKLPPVGWCDMVIYLYQAGVRYFHCCNTLPTPGGGLSGKALKPFSLDVVRSIKRMFDPKEVFVIGGGGITSTQDIDDYIAAGADHVSVASMLLWPWRWKSISKFVSYLDSKIINVS